jgi:mono/diheme cytochrome c family protein
MRARTFVSLVVFAACGLTTSSAFQSPAPATARTWPPALQAVPDDSPPQSPEREMQTFFLPPGYRVELVASEPLVEEPILIDWDADGRLWVIELLSYMQDLPATHERDPLGRISVLEDTNHDGRMDKKTIFLDGLVLPRALKVLEHGVLVGEPPHLWLARDTNGDLRADTKTLVCDCYGTELGNVEHNENSLMWAMDNWMYTSEGDTYFRWKDGKIETRKTLSRGQWGAAQDDFGRVYRNSNSSALHLDLISTPYFVRNPNLVRTRGSYELMGDPDELNATFPVRPNRGVNRGYQTGQLRADGTLATYTAVNSPIVYRGDRLPAELQGNVFVAEPSGNLISRIVVSDDGSGLRGRKAYPNAEFMTSTDERFRPVYLSSAPDGTIYLVDIYHGIIQQKSFITEYLRDHIVEHALEHPIHMGRIYRIVHDTTRRGEAPAMSSETPAQLVAHLSHPNGWWRDTAQRLLVERGDTSVRPALEALAASAADPRTRVHALWTLQGLDALDAALVVRALSDPSRDVRANAVRLAEPFLSVPDASVQAAVMNRLDDPDWSVRQQLAASLGALPAGPRETALTSLLERHAADPVVVDAALSGLRGGEAAVLRNLLQNTAAGASRDAAITMLAATIVRGGQDQAVESVFTLAAETSRPEWQRSAILRGAEVSLIGAAAPGSPRGGRAGGAGPAAAVDPNAPGGRSGPGGAPAFPREGTAGRGAGAPAAAQGRGGRGGRGGGNVVRFNREPAALTALAAQSGDLGTRAKALLARIEWPGKPGASAPVAPLTAEEQQRFAAGQKVYEGICQACHQEDGRGKEEVAPPLVGSALATAAATVPVRILLNGKEGSVGLMPPIGQTFTDDQIADVLTYIRRQWGNVGTPVDVQTVKDTRAAVAGRTRPWTNDELMALTPAGRGGRRGRGAQ